MANLILHKLIKIDDIFKRSVFAPFRNNRKFVFLDKAMNNPFLSSDDYMATFAEYQRVYHAFAKFISIIRFRRANIVIDTDLCLNPISIDTKNVMCIRQGSGRYLFLINDLIKIIQSSIGNSQSLFSMPKSAKNPYTNIPFNKSTLYNIYFFVLFRTIYRPELMFSYFNYNFNLRRFATMNEHVLRDYAINEFVETSDIVIMRDEILELLEMCNVLDIHEDFPPETLVRIMKPYLHLWLTAKYTLVGIHQQFALRRFKRMLTDFVMYNPKFGRKIIKIVYSSTRYKVVSSLVVSFNDKHEPIGQTRNFMKSHTQ
jgi:hypothetical protein